MTRWQWTFIMRWRGPSTTMCGGLVHVYILAYDEIRIIVSQNARRKDMYV